MLEKKMKTMSIVVVAGLVLALAPLASADLITGDIISNGGFELPGSNGAVPTGWTTDFNSYGQYTGAAHTGSYGFHPGGSSNAGGSYQELTTVIGSTYDVSVWIKSFATGTSELGVVIANTGSTAITMAGTSQDTGSHYGSNVAYNQTHTATSNAWSEVTFTFTAQDTATRLGLYYSGGGTKPLDLDDISVTPEPATMTMLALGGLGVLARRRRRS